MGTVGGSAWVFGSSFAGQNWIRYELAGTEVLLNLAAYESTFDALRKVTVGLTRSWAARARRGEF